MSRIPNKNDRDRELACLALAQLASCRFGGRVVLENVTRNGAKTIDTELDEFGS